MGLQTRTLPRWRGPSGRARSSESTKVWSTNLKTLNEYSLHVFTVFSEFNDKKYSQLKGLFENKTSWVKDIGATTGLITHGWLSAYLNWMRVFDTDFDAMIPSLKVNLRTYVNVKKQTRYEVSCSIYSDIKDIHIDRQMRRKTLPMYTNGKKIGFSLNIAISSHKS